MDNHLQHHGVKGMKWGVRRFQNKDGSLTAAGKKRAAKRETKDGFLAAAGKKRAAKREAKDLQKRQEKFLSDVNDPYKWTRSMNNASDKFNERLKSVNDKYKDDTFDADFSTKRGQQYN